MENKIKPFFMVCVPLRLFLVYIAYILPLNKLKYMGYLMLLPFVGFGYSFLKYKKGDKGAFGGNVWWNKYRLVHSINYLIFALIAINMNPKSYLVLLFDVILGIGFFSNKYFF